MTESVVESNGYVPHVRSYASSTSRCVACGHDGCWFWIEPATPAVVDDPAWQGRDAILVALDGVVIECQRPRCRASYRLVEWFDAPVSLLAVVALLAAGPMMMRLYMRRAVRAKQSESQGATMTRDEFETLAVTYYDGLDSAEAAP